jgi:hypothetical protein
MWNFKDWELHTGSLHPIRKILNAAPVRPMNRRTTNPRKFALGFMKNFTAKAKAEPGGGGGGGAIAKAELGGIAQPIGSLKPVSKPVNDQGSIYVERVH